MESKLFDRFSGTLAVLAGIAGILYSLTFFGRLPLFNALFLMLIGLLATAPLVSLYHRLRGEEMLFAQWALLLGIAGAIGTAVHGGYDLAVSINPPQGVPAALAALPSEIDPRGLLVFGVTSLAVFTFSWLIVRSGALPRPLGYVGYLGAFLSLILYLGRLIILDPTNPIIVVAALLNGFIVNPLWYIWLGAHLLRSAPDAMKNSNMQPGAAA